MPPKKNNKPTEEPAEPTPETDAKPTESEAPATEAEPEKPAEPLPEGETQPTDPATGETEPAKDGLEAENEVKPDGEPVDPDAEPKPTETTDPETGEPTETTEEPATAETQPAETTEPVTEEPQPVEGEEPKASEENVKIEEEEALDTEQPIDRIWDGKMKQEHLDYIELAKDIQDQSEVCAEIKQTIDERNTRAFNTKCEDREMSFLQMTYGAENDKLMAMMRSAIGLQFDEYSDRGDETQSRRKETTIEEDIAAARMLRDLCASCNPSPCNLDKIKQEDEKCKTCGASTGRKPLDSAKRLEKAVKRIEKTLKSLKHSLDKLKR